MKGHSLKEILERLGGGFVMHSEVTNVPKGSGLGTSSILSAACVKAVFEFMGNRIYREDLYAHVLGNGTDHVHRRRMAGSGRCYAWSGNI